MLMWVFGECECVRGGCVCVLVRYVYMYEGRGHATATARTQHSSCEEVLDHCGSHAWSEWIKKTRGKREMGRYQWEKHYAWSVSLPWR